MDDIWIAQAPLKKPEDEEKALDVDQCALDDRERTPEPSEAVEDSDADVSRGGHCAIEGAVHSPSRPSNQRATLEHRDSESSLVDRFVQIDLKEPQIPHEDDYEIHRASGSPVQPELFVLNVGEPKTPDATLQVKKSPGARRSGHESPPVSFLKNSANTPVFFRRDDDIAFPSGSEADSSFYGEDDDEGSSPTPLPDLPPGVYDSAAEDVESETADVDTDSVATDDGAGFFGRIAWALKKTREDLNVLLGCSGPTGPGCSGALSQLPGRDFDISFEEIEEIKFLGSGASGCVFLGMFRGEKVAVKKFRDVEATRIETQMLSRLSHPNIVRFLGVCNQPPVHCIVMEFCPKNLYEVIKHTRIPPTQICEWAHQIASGMEYLHDQNQIHRDLKSPNVLLAGDRRTLRISDFGTARRVGSRSLSEKTMCGSPPWMAPELIRNEPYGKTVDVWSYGVVLWELLTGEVPYRGVEQGAIIFGVANKSLHLPVPTTAPLGFSLLLKQCWNTEPKHRPAFRQILLHLDILLEDSGFAEVPVEAYFATQLKWKEEMKVAFEKMKQEEMEKRRTDQELLQRREEELAHAQDIRQLYESRLQTVSQLLAELRERERELGERPRGSEKKKRRARNRALLAPSRGYAQGTRRRSKDAIRRRSSDSPPRKVGLSKKFSAGSVGSPGLSPLSMSAVTLRKRSTSSDMSPSGGMSKPPTFPRARVPLQRKTTVLSAKLATKSNAQRGSITSTPKRDVDEVTIAVDDENKGVVDHAPEPLEQSEGWFSPKDGSKKKWIDASYQTSTV